MHDFSGFAERERSGRADPAIVQDLVDRIGPVAGEVGDAPVAAVGTAGRDGLDLCRGQGAPTARIAATGARVGLDTSQPMLDRAMLLTLQSDAVVDAIRQKVMVAAERARRSGWRVPGHAAIIVAEPA